MMDKPIGLNELSVILGVSRRTLANSWRAKVKEGKLPTPFYLGKTPRWWLSDLRGFTPRECAPPVRPSKPLLAPKTSMLLTQLADQ